MLVKTQIADNFKSKWVAKPDRLVYLIKCSEESKTESF